MNSETDRIADDITKGFPFFPNLHRILSSRTNSNPPVVTTGVGPAGRAVVHYQAPAGMVANPIGDELIDPALCGLGGSDWLTPGSETRNTVVDSFPSPVQSQNTVHSSADKENTELVPTTATSKRSKAAAITVSELVENAKATIKKIPAKRSFVKKCFVTCSGACHCVINFYCLSSYFFISSDNIAAANKRAAIAASHDNRRLVIEERNQLIKLFEIGVYSKDELLRKSEGLDGLEPTDTTNNGRDMSPLSSDEF